MSMGQGSQEQKDHETYLTALQTAFSQLIRQMPFSFSDSSAPADAGACVVNFLPRKREQGI